MSMDRDSDLGFCPGCGADIDLDEAYCHSCGRNLRGVEYSPRPQSGGNRARMAFIIMAIVGAFLLWMGASTLLDPQPVIDEVMLQMDEFGFGEDFAEQFVMFYGYSLVATGLLALAGGAMAMLRRFWLASIVIALLVTLSTPFFLFSFPAVVALYMLWKGRDEFV